MLNRFLYSFGGEISVVHRINPVIKLLGLFVYVLVCFFKFNQGLFVCNLSLVFLLMLLSNVDMMRYLKIVWKLKYVILLAYVVCMRFHMEWMSMNVLVFKLVFFVLYLSVIYFTTSRYSISKACSAIVNLFNIVGMGESKITEMIANIFVYLACFKESFEKRVVSGEIKGVVYSHSNIVDRWKLKVCSIRLVFHDTRLKMKSRKSDMKFRMYDKRVKKKYRYKNKLCLFDYIYVILNIGMLVFYVLKVR